MLTDYSEFPIDLLNKKLGIGASFNVDEMENLLNSKYKTRYSYLILSLLYPDRDWKDNQYHEDHISPKNQFTTSKLRNRGYEEYKIEEYQHHYNSISNIQLLTDSENREKNSKDFNEWISTRDGNFKIRHKIPLLDSYQFDNFLEFIAERKRLIQDSLNKI